MSSSRASISMALISGRGTMTSFTGRKPMSRAPETIRRRSEDRPRAPARRAMRVSSSLSERPDASLEVRDEGMIRPVTRLKSLTSGESRTMMARSG